ncbi:EAL and modified HD-GYP domain-containing signal transduction protein OS=Ureibacillus acetophenoni OX=614649 GN=SAMN05877842_105153 PE=4 SV=1 [Ureibacillus acetophenoni]
MKVFVARQPIFNTVGDVIAYELLYRNSEVNLFPAVNGDQATTEVIINSFINIGIEEISNGKLCFINFTENLLTMKLPTYFSKDDIVVEILETVEPSEELIHICKELKQLGYKIALDDFIFNHNNPFYYQLLNYADIIKVDIRNTSPSMLREIESAANVFNIKLLAEKVETSQEFETFADKGYCYFQGYFFSKPVIVSTHDIPIYFYSYIEVLKELTTSEAKIEIIAQLVERDLSLSFKLLKLINSSVFRRKAKISSIKQAIVLLGLQEFQKLIYILSVRDYQNYDRGISNEIIRISLVRAKMCESLKQLTTNLLSSTGYFMTGMFSLMDALLGVEMDEILIQLPLDDAISEALRGQVNDYKLALDLSIAIEKGNWNIVSEMCSAMQIDETTVCKLYKESLNWSNELLNEESLT